MEVITTHTNADFDTLASMVAAKKLYPNARLAFSGSLEKGLGSAVSALGLPMKFDRARDLNLDDITRLILVDIRHPSRIGRFSEIIGRKGLEVHVYDHHPEQEGDIKGDFECIRPYGSTATILTLLLKEKGIKPSPPEATVLMAGIYEDTGSLSFPSTVREDFEAALFLLSNGAELKRVSEFLKRELTADEVFALNELIRSETTYSIDGVDVVMATVATEKYRDDVATLAHRLMDMERFACLFLLAEMDNRVHVVIRSSLAEVDAGKIAAALGGGGHPHAASATLKGVTLIQAKEAVLGALRENAAPQRNAGTIMSAPAITLSPRAPMAEAAKLMRRYNINAAPVSEDGSLEGVITRQVVDRAVDHGLGGECVSEYMTTDVDTVTTSTAVDEIRRKVLSRGQRLLPVMKDGRVVGVITRTDLLKLLQEALAQTPPGGRKKRSVKSLLRERLPQYAFQLIEEAGEAAEGLGYQAYAVGGFVRDLLLKRENLDMDIVIEGDGIKFARELAKGRDLKVKAHDRFKTAVVKFPDGRKLDVATARLEYYEKPGALPTVEMSSLKLDLYRRDFTINTLAAALNPARFGELMDFFGAEADIKEKTVRVLHNLSFVEDPTRMLRAVKFSERFGFRIDRHTLRLIKNAVRLDILKEVSGARILGELRGILEDDAAASMLKRLDELGILVLIHKKIRWDGKTSALFERARETLAWHHLLYTEERSEGWLVLFLALTDGLRGAETEGLSQRLSLAGKKRLSVVRAKDDGLRAFNLIRSGKAASGRRLYEVLHPLPIEITLYLLSKADREDVKKAISTYISTLRRTKTILGGDDLKKLGVREGPRMGRLLASLLKKRLDGEVKTREDEEIFARRYAGKLLK